MVKGKTLGDESWDGFPPIADGTLILLMGSKEEDIATPPAQKIKFVEDMNESEIATAVFQTQISEMKFNFPFSH